MSELRSRSLVGSGVAARYRFGLVVSETNADVTSRLLEGAMEALREHGATAENIYEVRVPGAFELPMAAAQLLRQSRVDAVVCLGALVRGETPHFDVLAHATANAIQAVARSSGVPVTFGVVTCDSSEQAVERAGGEVGNKGTEAAIAAMEMIALYARLEGESRDG